METRHPSHHLTRVMHVSKKKEEDWDQFVKIIDDTEDNIDRNVVIAGFAYLKSYLKWYEFKKHWYLNHRLKKYLRNTPAK